MDAPSKVVAGVSMLRRPHSVPPPKLVPLTRSNEPSSSTLTIDTPEPMFTSRHGSCGTGSCTNDTAYFGGSGLGRSNTGGDGVASSACGCETE